MIADLEARHRPGARERSEIEAVLRCGVSAVRPVFQPVLELATGRVGGFEALARVQGDPRRGPDEWIAQAHRAGLGAELEALALRAALAVRNRPAGTFLALNVSPCALLSGPVAEALPDDLSDVVVELTEHELFTAGGALELRLADLRARGARVALDDAGAGYAGLQQLIRVAPDILKLDRSLVDGAHADPSRYSLLEALVGFAGSTGAVVCGEGVEDLADLRVLAELDATYAQGYALARPAPGWRGIDAAVEATAPAHRGVRVSPGARGGAAWTRELADLGDDLGGVDHRLAFVGACRRAAAVLNAEDVSLMRVDGGELELLSSNLQDEPGARWPLAEYPATVRALDGRATAQVVVGDPAGDPDEVAELERLGYGALLMVPVDFAPGERALLEVYRRHAQAYTRAEVDRARLVGQQFGAALARVLA